MSYRYTELLEACNKAQLTGKLGILEESAIDEATSIKMQLILNENLSFIKNQITKTPLVESIQADLAERWTNAILEDIDVEPSFGNKIGTIKDDIVSGAKTFISKLAPAASEDNIEPSFAKNIGAIKDDIVSGAKNGLNTTASVVQNVVPLLLGDSSSLSFS